MTQAETKTATLDATRPQPITPEAAVYDIKAAGSPRISPDRKRIVYAVGKTDRETGKGISQLWLCDPAEQRPELVAGRHEHRLRLGPG